MRYYLIKITSRDAGASNSPGSGASVKGKLLANWTSHPRGRNDRADPGALQVDLDLAINSADADAPLALRVWGLPLKTIADTSSLFNAEIDISAGFATGLPLATLASEYAGPIFRGTIVKAFGTWEGTDTRLDLYLTRTTDAPPAGGPNPQRTNKPLTIDWKRDTPLEKPLRAALSAAFPQMKIAMEISDRIVARQNQPGIFASMDSFALWVRRISQDILGGGAYGVSIVPDLGQLRVFDGTKPGGTAKRIDPNVLIGQPTWFDPATVIFKTVMRADLKVGDTITLPKTFYNGSVAASAQGSSAATGQLGITGSFTIGTVRHIGSFRQPTADAWVSVFTAYTTSREGNAGFSQPAFPLPGSSWPFSLGGP
jgi:hypothetical protein